MDVHGIEIRRAGYILIGKIKNLGFHQHALVGSLIEFNKAAYCGGGCPASYPGNSGRCPETQ